MKTYVVNLEQSTDRRAYMQDLLISYPVLETEYVAAVDGRRMTPADLQRCFDRDRFARIYLREVLPGEIGCTLSHQRCYRRLSESAEAYALILEDDIIVQESFETIIPLIEPILDQERPVVVLLSGWFWYGRKRTLSDKHKLAEVVDGCLTHGYAINRCAARLMQDDMPYYPADAWDVFRRRGVRIYGLCPHPLDQDWGEGFQSTIVDRRPVKNKSVHWLSWLRKKRRVAVQRIFAFFHHFEPAEDILNKQ